jgi:CheY-like chemotaxis protein
LGGTARFYQPRQRLGKRACSGEKSFGVRNKYFHFEAEFCISAGPDASAIGTTEDYHLPASFPVYVVDDDPNIRAWAEILCEEMELCCRIFGGGEEFLEALDQLEPGCLLLDMRMPKRCGLRVQAELIGRGKAFPVIAMSGFGDVDVAVETMKMGAIEFLEKPFSQKTLMEALEQGFSILRARTPAADG